MSYFRYWGLLKKNAVPLPQFTAASTPEANDAGQRFHVLVILRVKDGSSVSVRAL
jgi:hypothetical protein